jgi:hypothetical protein
VNTPNNQEIDTVKILSALMLVSLLVQSAVAGWEPPDNSWISLFNGKDLSGWKPPAGEHNWQVVDGVIDYEAKGGHLTSEKSFEDYKLHIEWRIKRTEGKPFSWAGFTKDGEPLMDENGKRVKWTFNNADSGIYLRGTAKSQTNIWCWPCGSGQFWSYMKHKDPVVRKAAWPDKNADKPVGEWNAFDITVTGEEVEITLNGELIMPKTKMPGFGTSGPLVLQHHGGKGKNGVWNNASALVQFRNVWLKPLPKK